MKSLNNKQILGENMINKFCSKTCSTVIITTSDNRILLQERDDNPNIECSGCFSFIAGFVEDDETPLEGVKREMNEEIVHKSNKSVKFSNITYLGSNIRYEYNRPEYVFHSKLIDNINNIKITEGKGFKILTINECLKLKNLAPHHKRFLLKYQNLLSVILEKQKKLNDENNEITIEDLVTIEQLSNEKNLETLEKGTGFVTGDNQIFSGLVHPAEDIKFIGCLQFIPDNPRGNHFHFRKVEYMLILTGKLHARFEIHNNSNQIKEVILEKGQLMRVLPGCIHTLTAIDNKVVVIEFSPQKFISNDVKYK